MSILTKRLREIVEQEFPEVTLPKSAMFLPMDSLEAGELSTTAAIEIAKVLKQRAEIVAERLMAQLSPEIDAEWRHDKGYIVCSRLPADVLLAEVQDSVADALLAINSQSPLETATVRKVWCLIPDSTSPAYARMRMVARATLQGLLAVVYQARAQLCLSPCQGREVSSVAEVLDLFRQAIEWIVDNESEVRRQVVLPERGDSIAVWTTHHYHEKLDSSLRQELAQMRRAGVAQVTMPDDGWLLSRDRVLSEILELAALRRVIERLNTRDDWFRFLLHFSSTTPSGDFDPAVALFDECASPLWNMRTLLERYEGFRTKLDLPLDRRKLIELIQQVTSYRKLQISGVFMPLYTASAILNNNVVVWCGAFERLAREGHAFINAPATRLALEQNAQDAICREIAAGLGFGLSCIMPLVTDS